MESLDKISSCRKRRIMSRISLNQVESSERFYRIPKVFTDENSYYCTMRLESKFAYGLLKDRFELSIKNKWVDKEKNIYLIFTVKELEKVLGCKKDKVHQIKRELAQYGLLEDERQGLNKPNRIYVLNIDTMRTSEKPTSNEASDTKDVGNSDIRTSEKPTSGSLKNRHQDICNSDTNDTEYSDTEFSDTDNKEDDDENKKEANNSFQNSLQEVADIELGTIFDTLAASLNNQEDVEAIKQELSTELVALTPQTIRSNFEAAWEYTQSRCESDSYFGKYLLKNLQMKASKSKRDKVKRSREQTISETITDDYFSSVDALRKEWGYAN